MSAGADDFDAYVAGLPDDARLTLEQLRLTIRALAPDAVESFSYGLPTFKYRGRPLIYVGAAKNHCALYGIDVEGHKEELAGYDTSKGTLRFPAGRPPPDALVRSLLEARMGQIDAATERRGRKKPSVE